MFESEHRWSLRILWNRLELCRWQREWRVAGGFGLLLGGGSLVVLLFDPESVRRSEDAGYDWFESVLWLNACCFIVASMVCLFIRTRIVFDSQQRTVYQFTTVLVRWHSSRQELTPDAYLEIREELTAGTIPQRENFHLFVRDGKRDKLLVRTLLLGEAVKVAVVLADFTGMVVRQAWNTATALYDPNREAIKPRHHPVDGIQNERLSDDDFPSIPADCRVQLALEDEEVVMTLPPVGWGPRQKNILLSLCMMVPLLPLVILPGFLPTRFKQDEELPSSLWFTLLPIALFSAFSIGFAIVTSRVEETLRFGPDGLDLLPKS